VTEPTDDVVLGDYHCPRCDTVLKEKKPKDRHLARNRDRTVRLFCTCGYVKDIVVTPDQFRQT
jgi:hypothetical protein